MFNARNSMENTINNIHLHYLILILFTISSLNMISNNNINYRVNEKRRIKLIKYKYIKSYFKLRI